MSGKKEQEKIEKEFVEKPLVKFFYTLAVNTPVSLVLKTHS